MTICLLLNLSSNFLTFKLQTQMSVEVQKKSSHKKPRFLIRSMRSPIPQDLALKLIFGATVSKKVALIYNLELKTR